MPTMTALDQCSNCGRAKPTIGKIHPARAAGVHLAICDACVAEVATMMADGPTRIPGAARTCTFCLKGEEQVAVIVGVGQALICDDCVDTYRREG